MDILNKLIDDIFDGKLIHTEEEWNISLHEQLKKILSSIVNKDEELSLRISVYFLILNFKNSKIVCIDEFPPISISHVENRNYFDKVLNVGYETAASIFNNLTKSPNVS